MERRFGADELIVSKTDPKGIIRYANSVFLRISDYVEEDVLGRPHNLIRHPDMPRCVFRLLWETLESGQEIFAYIVNLAADGAHYWVLAHVTPSFGPGGEIVGYHSNRRLPDRRAVDQIASIYAAILAEERRHTAATAAVDAGTAKLREVLVARGQTYDEFVWSIGQEAGTPAAPTGVAR